MHGSMHGTLHTMVLGPEHKRKLKQPTQFSYIVDTVPKLPCDTVNYSLSILTMLMASIFCLRGLTMKMTFPSCISQQQMGASLFPPLSDTTLLKEDSGWIMFLFQLHQHRLLQRHMLIKALMLDLVCSENTLPSWQKLLQQARDTVVWLDASQPIAEAQRAYAMSVVTNIFFGQHAEERTLLGVKMGLKARKSKLSKVDFREEYQHMGSCPGCKICIMVMGCMRRIYQMINPPEETRPTYIILYGHCYFLSSFFKRKHV